MSQVEKEMRDVFEVQQLKVYSDKSEIVVDPYAREELRVSADTISARLAPMRAVLYQKDPAPFTARDLDLRSRILKLYPRNRSTPFPFFYQEEPKFEVIG